MKSIFKPILLLSCLIALPAVAKKLNVLFVIVDDLRPLISCQGDPIAKTPSLDKLAADGMVFERAYAQYPICGPSRGSFMSGMRPDTTGLMGNNTPFHNVLNEELTLNRYFMQQGYAVFGAGKVYHNSIGDDWSEPYFKSEWLDHVKPENKRKADIFFTPKSEGLPPSIEAEDVGDDAYCDGQAAAASEKWIAQAAKDGKPFMMVTGFRKPHLPWCAPKKYWDLYERSAMPVAANRYHPIGAPEIALKHYGELFGYGDIPNGTPLTDELIRQSMHGYYACVSYADAQLGRVLDALKKAGVYDNTIIVLCGDNGYHHGNNGVWTKGVCWETTNHVPLLLKVPGAKKGQRSDALVELLDIYPTLCRTAGLPVPKHCEGKSLLPLVEHPKQEWNGFSASQFRKGKIIARSIRTDRYRFTLWEKGRGNVVGTELYDYEKDPQGNVNLAASPENKHLVEKFTKLHQSEWPSEY
ncbi:Arylsulfatase [Pontiella desulfatans]|uniref:Arylsulfatase n=1 Tax=Pontiella desulfatans TaxID=2750659 RepID=A0A6C2TYC9_PONDE|nr:sulfatase [Pontiella desulfatans]SPS73686.1 sulfatase S1_7 [Kiritimatiellales bacterium]VGO12605.1 Arylsulfatase [Pontiella desulfatans]